MICFNASVLSKNVLSSISQIHYGGCIGENKLIMLMCHYPLCDLWCPTQVSVFTVILCTQFLPPYPASQGCPWGCTSLKGLNWNWLNRAAQLRQIPRTWNAFKSTSSNRFIIWSFNCYVTKIRRQTMVLFLNWKPPIICYLILIWHSFKEYMWHKSYYNKLCRH